MKENKIYYTKGVFFNRIVKVLRDAELTVGEISDRLKEQKSALGRPHRRHPTTSQITQTLTKYPHFEKSEFGNFGVSGLGYSTKVGKWKLSKLGEEE